MLHCEITELSDLERTCEIADLYKQLDEKGVVSVSGSMGIDDIMALTIDYDTNHKLSDIRRIIDYYNDESKAIQSISRRKEDTINALVLFELDPVNVNIVTRRKTMWLYLKVIREDKHLSKYLILK
jgi:hypothetical protein